MATPIMLYHEVINACAKSVECERIYDTLEGKTPKNVDHSHSLSPFSEMSSGSFVSVAPHLGVEPRSDICARRRIVQGKSGSLPRLSLRNDGVNFSSSSSAALSSSPPPPSSSQLILPAEKRSSAWLVANEPSMPAKMTNATAELN